MDRLISASLSARDNRGGERRLHFEDDDDDEDDEPPAPIKAVKSVASAAAKKLKKEL